MQNFTNWIARKTKKTEKFQFNTALKECVTQTYSAMVKMTFLFERSRQHLLMVLPTHLQVSYCQLRVWFLDNPAPFVQQRKRFAGFGCRISRVKLSVWEVSNFTFDFLFSLLWVKHRKKRSAVQSVTYFSTRTTSFSDKM